MAVTGNLRVGQRLIHIVGDAIEQLVGLDGRRLAKALDGAIHQLDGSGMDGLKLSDILLLPI